MQRATFILAYFFICVNCFAQQYPFVHYTPKDGLVNSRVKKAYQDSKGRMYFLTYGGLSVFDGMRFKNYTTQNGLASNVVNDILEIGDDSLLIASNTGNNLNILVKGKIELFKPEVGPFKFTNASYKHEGDKIPVINEFYKHDDNKIYLSCDNGLFVLENKKIIHELNIGSLSDERSDLPYLSHINGTGNYLVLTTNEMNSNKAAYLYDIKKNRICDVLPKQNDIFLIGKDNNTHIWLSIADKLFILDTAALAKGKLLLMPPILGYKQVKNYSTINVVFEKSCIWAVYRNQEYRNVEIHRIEETGAIFRMSLPEQATSTDIKNIIVDKENTIWLCNDGEGVFKIVNSPMWIFQNPLGESTQSQINNVFYSNNVTWFSTSSNKLFRKSEKGLHTFSTNLKQSPGIIYQGDDKLLAGDNKNIYEANLSGEKSIFFRKIITLPDPDFWIKSPVIDFKGALISSQNTGLSVWKKNKMIFHLSIDKPDLYEGLAFDKNDLLWAVKRYEGIDVFSLNPDNPLNYLQPVYHFTPGQITGSPRSFVIDKTGLIWIGTRDDGLICYKHTGNSLKQLYHFNTGNGLTDNFVTTLACDSLNNIIVGTQTGLDRIIFNANSYRVENLSKSSNFFALILWTWADTKQAYALSYSGALLQLSPPAEQTLDYTPRLILEEMRVNAQPIPGDKKNFRYKENNISFLVAAPSFLDEKQVAFSYLLEGSGNKQWSDTASTNSVINLTNLSAGEYLLKIKAFFPSSSYTPAELSYSFEIQPPWWKTWWFRGLSGVLILGLLILALRFYYRRKLERQLAALEKQQAIEKERTRIATDMHDDLGAGLSRIKFLSETIGIKKQQSEPIEEDVNKIREYSHEMIDKMGEIVWALNEKNDTLSDLLSYTRAYAVEYLSQHGISCTVEAPEQLPAGFVSGEFRRNVYLTVKEALHNVVKHSQASSVTIRISAAQILNIEIEDNGTGFNKANIRQFSNGLSNMESRIKEINGEFKIENGAGTTVKINIPLSA
jgi:signal transduction histidine kinase